jgi:hypothetical protein
MALQVLSRPQKELTVNNPPETYEESYYTSRWNASELPMQYQIESDLYPNNTVDSVDTFSVVDSDGGYARFKLTGSYETYLKLEYLEIITSSVASYIGKWKIRRVFAEYITLDLPFSATATGTLQRTYRNYYVNVKLYAGIAPEHPLALEDPMSLISTILVEPQSDNIAIVDVSGLVKSKVNGTVDFNESQNHINQWTSFYIEFAETYDVSNGTIVTSETTSYTLDVYEDCTESDELLYNDFESDPSGTWDNVESNSQSGGEIWSWTGNDMEMVLAAGVTDDYSQIFKQDFNFIQGLRYNLIFNLEVTQTYTGIFDVYLDAGLPTETLIYREFLTSNGSVSVNTYFTPSSNYSNIGFKGALFLGLGTLDIYAYDFNVISGVCTAYIYSLYSKMPFQYVNGGNVGQFVQNSNQNVFENKFLTLFDRPTYFLGKTFYLSTIIPEETLSLLSGVGGGALRVIQYDNQNNALQTDRISVEQEGDGVYRFTLDSITFLTSTKYATAQLIIEPLNLFQDGDGGTFDTTADPTGEPPSDWNITQGECVLLTFDNSIFYEGTGSLRVNTFDLFNCSDADFIALYNAFDVKPSNQVAIWQNELFEDLKAEGIYNELDFLYIMGSNSLFNSKLNWIDPASSLVVNGSPTFTTIQDATLDKYDACYLLSLVGDNLDLIFNPFGGGGNFQLNSASIGFLCNSNGVNNEVSQIGTLDDNNKLVGRQVAGGSNSKINGGTATRGANVVPSVGRKIDHISTTLTGSSKRIFYDGSELANFAGSPSPFTTAPVSITNSKFVAGRYTLGTAPRRIYAAYAGAYLTPTQIIAFENTIKTYFSRLGYTDI